MSSNIKNMIFNEDINNSIRILGDVRERDPKYSKYVVNNDNWNDLESRQVIYSKKGSFIPDAERWQCAMCSYLKYKLFENCEIVEDASKRPILSYLLDNGEKVYIPADLLTNPVPIIEKYNHLFKDKALLYSFLRVSYTPGNFCPVWYNIGNGQGNCNDTIWYKLNRYIIEVNEFIGFKEQPVEKYTSLVKRKVHCQIFDVLPYSTKDKNKIIEGLLFQDFFDEEGRTLQGKSIPDDEKGLKQYIYDTVRCIISRGYRIINKINTEFSEYDISIINDLCKEIGL